MKLYDQKSPIDWFYLGYKTLEEMQSEERFNTLFSEPCVLFDNGVDKVYSYCTLRDMCAQYGVDSNGDPIAIYDNLLAAMNPPSIPSDSERITDLEAAICDLYMMSIGGE